MSTLASLLRTLVCRCCINDFVRGVTCESCIARLKELEVRMILLELFDIRLCLLFEGCRGFKGIIHNNIEIF
jgi:hypothetical protein